MTETVWGTVDKLIHDLGAIRAFVDEAEAMPEVCAAPEVAEVRGAMDAATDAITHLFGDTQAPSVEAAWTAIARAQDAVARARVMVGRARAGYEAAERMREFNRDQTSRTFQQRERVLDHADRVRRKLLPRMGPGSEDDGGGL